MSEKMTEKMTVKMTDKQSEKPGHMANLPPIQFIDLKTQYKVLKPKIDAQIQKVLDHGAYINGPEIAELETQLTKFVGCKYSLACANGTDALLIPLMAQGIGPGDEVITTAFSFIATAEVISLVGATPVYVDIDPVTFNMDTSLIEKAITPRTKAIMPVSLYGQAADFDEINAIAAKHHLFVLEDSAQSFGAVYKGKRSGNLSPVAGTSFYPGKPLGCYGDGGAIFTNDDKLYKKMKELREHGSESRYYHTNLGINARLDTLQCAILLPKLERYAWEIEQRERVAKRYHAAFESVKKTDFGFPKINAGNSSVWAQYTLTVHDRPQFQKRMTELGVPTAIHYPRIMPDQPWYKEQLAKAGVKTEGQWTHAKWAAEHVISLPMYPDMDDATQDRIINAVLKALD